MLSCGALALSLSLPYQLSERLTCSVLSKCSATRIVFWQKSRVYRPLTLYQEKSFSPKLKKCRRASWNEKESVVVLY